jgi:hypothetical protein
MGDHLLPVTLAVFQLMFSELLRCIATFMPRFLHRLPRPLFSIEIEINQQLRAFQY